MKLSMTLTDYKIIDYKIIRGELIFKIGFVKEA